MIKDYNQDTQTIAVDFDGVIHLYGSGWQDGNIYDVPVPGVRTFLNGLHQEGWRIVIYSCRSNEGSNGAGAISAWLLAHDIPFDEVATTGKPHADVYLDDRAVRFEGNWADVTTQIRKQPWTKQLTPEALASLRQPPVVARAVSTKVIPHLDATQLAEVARKLGEQFNATQSPSETTQELLLAWCEKTAAKLYTVTGGRQIFEVIAYKSQADGPVTFEVKEAPIEV